MKVLGFIFLFQRIHLNSKIWSGFTNFLSVNKILQILNEFSFDLNKPKEFWNEIDRGYCRYGLQALGPRRLHRPRPLGPLCPRRRLALRAHAACARDALTALRERALPPGGVSDSGSPVDKWWPGLAQNHLHDVIYTPLHEQLHETAKRWGFHGEAEKLTELGSILGWWWWLVGWWRLRAVPQLWGKHMSVRHRHEKLPDDEVLGKWSSPEWHCNGSKIWPGAQGECRLVSVPGPNGAQVRGGPQTRWWWSEVWQSSGSPEDCSSGASRSWCWCWGEGSTKGKK
jgi:hypothetical protein